MKKNNKKRNQLKVQNSSNKSREQNILDANEALHGKGLRGDRGFVKSEHKKNARFFAELYARSWEARKIIDIPVDDMFRKKIIFSGLDNKNEKIFENELIRLKVIETFRKAMIIERLFGGAVIFLGVKNQLNLSEKIDINQIKFKDLANLSVVSKHCCFVEKWYEDPFEANFEEPEIYSIKGTSVHESRLIIFDGDPLFKKDEFDLNDCQVVDFIQGFGHSVLKSISNDIVRAVGTREAAYHLVNTASVIFTSIDLAMANATKNGRKGLRILEDMLNQISLYRAAVVDSGATGDVNVKQHSASFGSVPELVTTTVEIICAAADIPAVRFLGTPPSGLNTDGKSALENYYGRIDSEKQTKLLPKINKFLPLFLRSVFEDKVNFDDIFVEFQPLWVTTEKEDAENKKIKADTWRVLADSGIFSDHELLKLSDNLGLIEYEADDDEAFKERDEDVKSIEVTTQKGF